MDLIILSLIHDPYVLSLEGMWFYLFKGRGLRLSKCQVKAIEKCATKKSPICEVLWFSENKKKNSLKMYNLCFSYQIYYSHPSICLIFIWVLCHHCSMPTSSKILPKNIKIAVFKIFPLWYIILGHRQSSGVYIYIHITYVCVYTHKQYIRTYNITPNNINFI